ncbi:MAG: nickel/cobalt exporter [Myxococcota bacterium]|jgi:nickel/cobalt exporter
MTPEASQILLFTAAAVAMLHTLVGVDHYLPFVVLGRSRKWSLKKTLGVTAACGVGHLVGSVLLGFIGIGLGMALDSMALIEGVRGTLAAWGLIAFGLVYAAWSMLQTSRGKKHAHPHAHDDGTVHLHGHNHHGTHAHPHPAVGKPALSTMSLFVIFVLGPCEALIPLVMAPAFADSWSLVLGVTVIFSVVTVGTMLVAVAVGSVGIRMVNLGWLERHANTLAGLAIAAGGLSIQLLGI